MSGVGQNVESVQIIYNAAFLKITEGINYIFVAPQPQEFILDQILDNKS